MRRPAETSAVGRLLAAAVALTLGAASSSSAFAECVTNPSISPADIVAMTRVGMNRIGRDAWQRVDGRNFVREDVFASFSPDGSAFAVALIKGDVDRDGNWLELLVGDRRSIDGASQARVVARLFTRGLGNNLSAGGSLLTIAGQNPIVWLDNGNVALRWTDDTGVVQAFRIDVLSGEARQLTQGRTNVVTFAATPNGVLYSALLSDQEYDQRYGLDLNTGYTLDNSDTVDLLPVIQGHRASMRDRNRVRIYYSTSTGEREIEVNGFSPAAAHPLQYLAYAPNGAVAATVEYTSRQTSTWRRYMPDLFAGYSVETAVHLRQAFVIDLQQARIRPLWDAASTSATRLTWSPDNGHLLVGPTYLPAARASDAGLRGQAYAVVHASDGAYIELQLPAQLRNGGAITARWESQQAIVLENASSATRFVRTTRGWRASDDVPRTRSPDNQQFVQLRLRQGPNAPPMIFAADDSGTERLVYDPNPGILERFRFGRVEDLTWSDADERSWIGRLYYPNSYRPDVRYPLVIQLTGVVAYENAGFVSDDFSPSGVALDGLGPGQSAYSAQSLASRGIMVLATPPYTYTTAVGTREERRVYVGEIESAVRHLARRQLIDADKVGLVGFSRNGLHVEWALTHSDFLFAAAIAADNFDAGYWQRQFYGWNDDSHNLHDAPPFGEGLGRWLESAPGFNVDRVRTPLRLTNEQGPNEMTAFKGWELYNQMRYLGLPVELHVIPDVDHGAHPPQNPRQILANQDGAVDWFDFWLNDCERPGPERAQQYQRWRRLRVLRDRALAEPRRPLLSWRSTPAPQRPPE